MKKIFVAVLAVVGSIMLLSNPVKAYFDFKDVPKSAEFYPAISWSASSGLVKGYNYETFKPKSYLTEAHFALMFARFIDADAFAKNASMNEREVAYQVVLKKHNIILKGQNDKKQREQIFTRLDLAKAFYTYVEGKVPTSDKQAIDWMYQYNITKGKNSSADKYVNFGGSDRLKREHMAQFLKNLYTNWYFEAHVLKKSFKETALFQDNAPFHSPTLVDLNGDGKQELVVTYETYKSEYSIRMEGYRYYGVYTYNDTTNMWDFIDGGFLFTPGKDGGLTYEVKSLTGDNTEQLLIYYYAYRSLSVAAITGKDLNDIKLSLPDLYAHPSFEWAYKGNGIVIGPIGHYTGFYRIENGMLTRKSLTQIPTEDMPTNIIEMNYTIDENGYVNSAYRYGDTIQAKVGQKIVFTQGKYNWQEKPVRIMSSVVEGVYDKDDAEMAIYQYPGLIKYHILPYNDWDKEFTIYVRVSY